MIVAVTGGTGFIGRRLVDRLLEAGDSVRLLTRRSPVQVPWANRVEVISGDLSSDTVSLAAFTEGADVLYHCAGEIRRPARMRTLHVDGTRRLITAAAGRVQRWVQLSSVGAYGQRKNGIVDESTPPVPHGKYEQTKLESDVLVESAAAERAFEHVILRPSIVFGPEMLNGSLAQMIALIERRMFFFIGPPGASVNSIYVDNVAHALVHCGTCPAAIGRTYNLSDWRTLEDFIGAISAALGQSPPTLRLPEPPVRLAARVLGRLPGVPLTEARVDALCNRTRYPSDRIERELGYVHAVSMEEGVARTVAAWRQSRVALRAPQFDGRRLGLPGACLATDKLTTNI